MVSTSLETAVFCVCSSLLAVLLRQYAREQSMLAALAACSAVIGGAMLFLSPLAGDVREIFTEAGVADSYISLIFKAAAICFITQITCDLCRDCGESAIASAAELWGRGALTFMALPLVKVLLERINQLLQGAL